MSHDWSVLAGGEHSVFNFEPAGPVAEAYMYDVAPGIPMIMGPFGSGKTTGSILKCPLMTLQVPVCKDGVIRARGCIFRDQYRALYRTTLESWFKTFPRDFPNSHFEGGQDRPAKHTIRFRTPKGTLVEQITDFFAIGDHAIEELLKGYEPSWGYGNEVDMLHQSVLTFVYGRLGRYPSRDMLADPNAKMPSQVFGDLNPPDIDHWIYQECEEKNNPLYRLYKQPSGLSNEAENRKGVPRTRYEEMLALPPDQVQRFVHGKFGYSVDGKPVYPEFSERVHVSKDPLEPIEGIPLSIGVDGGGHPAATIGQTLENGQDRCLREVYLGAGVGPGRFTEALVDVLTSEFRGIPVGGVFGDPSAFFGADKIAGELSFMETVEKGIGYRVMPAPSNEPAIRTEAVRYGLVRNIDGETPGYLVDRRCRMLIGGFIAKYRLRRVRVGTRDVFQDKPDKSMEEANVHDAEQYRVLGRRGRAGVIQEAARAGRAGNVVPGNFGRGPRTDFNVFET